MGKIKVHVLYNNTLTDNVMKVGNLLSELGYHLSSTKKMFFDGNKNNLYDEKSIYFLVMEPYKNYVDDKMSDTHYSFIKSFKYPYILITDINYCEQMPGNAMDIITLPITDELLIKRFKQYKPMLKWIINNINLQISYDLETSEMPVFNAYEDKTLLSQIGEEMYVSLSGIENAASLILETDLSIDQKIYIDSLKNNLIAANRIVQEIMEFSLLQKDQWVRNNEDFNLREWINTIISVVEIDAIRKKNKISLYIDDKVPHMLNGDNFHLSRVLFLLLDNAIKYTVGGEVRVELALVNPYNENKKVNLAIKIIDTGIGMSKEKLERVFEVGKQTNKGGLGLSLSMISTYVSTLGGSIQVDSELEKGTSFEVVIPFDMAELAYDELLLGEKKLVLLAEDNQRYIKLFSILFEKINVEVVLAKDEKQILSLLAKKNVDMMVINVRMSDLKGYDIIRKVRERERVLSQRTPIIAFSEFVNKSDKHACELAGVEELITKPINKKLLRNLVLSY